MNSIEKDDVQTSIASGSPSAKPLFFIADRVNSALCASATLPGEAGARQRRLETRFFWWLKAAVRTVIEGAEARSIREWATLKSFAYSGFPRWLTIE